MVSEHSFLAFDSIDQQHQQIGEMEELCTPELERRMDSLERILADLKKLAGNIDGQTIAMNEHFQNSSATSRAAMQASLANREREIRSSSRSKLHASYASHSQSRTSLQKTSQSRTASTNLSLSSQSSTRTSSLSSKSQSSTRSYPPSSQKSSQSTSSLISPSSQSSIPSTHSQISYQSPTSPSTSPVDSHLSPYSSSSQVDSLRCSQVSWPKSSSSLLSSPQDVSPISQTPTLADVSSSQASSLANPHNPSSLVFSHQAQISLLQNPQSESKPDESVIMESNPEYICEEQAAVVVAPKAGAIAEHLSISQGPILVVGSVAGVHGMNTNYAMAKKGFTQNIVRTMSLDFGAWTACKEEIEKIEEENILKKYADYRARIGVMDKFDIGCLIGLYSGSKATDDRRLETSDVRRYANTLDQNSETFKFLGDIVYEPGLGVLVNIEHCHASNLTLEGQNKMDGFRFDSDAYMKCIQNGMGIILAGNYKDYVGSLGYTLPVVLLTSSLYWKGFQSLNCSLQMVCLCWNLEYDAGKRQLPNYVSPILAANLDLVPSQVSITGLLLHPCSFGSRVSIAYEKGLLKFLDIIEDHTVLIKDQHHQQPKEMFSENFGEFMLTFLGSKRFVKINLHNLEETDQKSRFWWVRDNQYLTFTKGDSTDILVRITDHGKRKTGPEAREDHGYLFSEESAIIFGKWKQHTEL